MENMHEEKKNISLKYLMMKQGFKLLNPIEDISSICIDDSDVNRLGLQLTGFFADFDKKRVQIIGQAENTFLATKTKSEKKAIFETLAKTNIPCILYTRNISPDETAMEVFTKKNIPILQSELSTTEVIAELTRFLKVEFAPTITVHGVLIDVYGEGVLITGESGIGKSEAALELIQRGHRLVSDDSVEISRVSKVSLLGRSPAITKGLMEVRGIGVIDIMRCYGTESVLEQQNINLVINLLEWDPNKKYDRLGNDVKSTNILGNEVEYYEIPIRPGRNIAIIVEACAVNHRSRLMGFNPVDLIERRMNERNKQ